MKRIIINFICILFSLSALAQGKKHDSLAILIIDRMTDVIGDLESCSFKLNVANDIWSQTTGLVKQFTDYEVYMSGPSKMLINIHGHRGHRQYMYNGHHLAFYSFDENNYGLIPAPKTTIETIDSIHSTYEHEFPAADFFYPAFTDDLLADVDTLRYLGIVKINGKEYFHVSASGRQAVFQFWINNDAYNLPAKFSIAYKTLPGVPQYLASFSDWQINPTLPNAMFDFLPPPNAARVRIMSKNDK